MKLFSILCISCFIGISYAQDTQSIDQRLVDSYGEDAVNLYENNQDYYNFLIYELDNSFEIMEATELTPNSKYDLRDISSVVDKEGKVFNIDELQDLSTFNFTSYNFVRAQNDRVYYELGDGRVLVFYSLVEIKNNYGK